MGTSISDKQISQRYYWDNVMRTIAEGEGFDDYKEITSIIDKIFALRVTRRARPGTEKHR